MIQTQRPLERPYMPSESNPLGPDILIYNPFGPKPFEYKPCTPMEFPAKREFDSEYFHCKN